MACLYCGKEIGPIRLLRDSEFCSPQHRKEYKSRLQKVLVQVGEPETVPTHIAPFKNPARPDGGSTHRAVASFDFKTIQHTAEFPTSWSLTLPEVRDSIFARIELIGRDVSVRKKAPESRAEAVPYFESGIAAERLRLPEPRLGAAALRTSEGSSLNMPAARAAAAPGESSAKLFTPSPVARHDYGLIVPPLALEAAECEELRGEPDPAASEIWIPVKDAQPAIAVNQPWMSQPVTAAAELRMPAELPQAAIEPLPPADEFADLPSPSEQWMPTALPTPAAGMLSPFSGDAFAIANFNLGRLKTLSPGGSEFDQLRITVPTLPPGQTACLQIPASQPAEREVTPASVKRPLEYSAAAIQLAPLALEALRDPMPEPMVEEPAATRGQAAQPKSAGAAAPPPPAAQPARPAAAASRPSSRPAARTKAGSRSSVAEGPQSEVPQAGLFPVDYQCPTGPRAPRPDLVWMPNAPALQMRAFAVRPVFDRLEEQSAAKPERSKPAFVEIFTMPETAAVYRRKAARHALTAIAASLTVATALWFGASAGKFGRELLAREAARELAAAARSRANSGNVEIASDPAERPAPEPLKHPVAWLRTAAAKRAAVEIADSFERGMQAWGSKTEGLAPGWSRSSDGYVRPGQLALFQPTLRYTDYHMEFFGQIENKSMSWVVRGKDTQNYYAMKFKVVEPGLRPVLSMVHYPVVGGKQGHKVEVPLSVMVHNNTPYHVSVNVKGSHYTASIEGQEVDSWSDDTLLAGGVGFFADAGARARIYWMKVSKNDDWFGRLCNYVAGSMESQETASLQEPAWPKPRPDQPEPTPSTAALWPAETAEPVFGRPQRGRSSWKGDIDEWSS